MVARRLILGCGALAHDMVRLIKHNKGLNELIDVQCLPAKLHNTPQLIAAEVDKVLASKAHNYADVFVAYGDCGTAGELDKVLQNYSATRLPGAHCYEFFAGKDDFEALIEEELGSFFVTDYLVRHFQRLVIEGLGLDRYPELFPEYFRHYRRFVYLAQTDDPQLQALAEKHARDFGMQYEYRQVGIRGLAPLTAANQKFQIEVNHVPG